MSKSTVSRAWVKGTKKQLERLLTRNLKDLQLVAVFIDGKRFAKLGVVVALGVGADGKKHVLGIYESSTENSAAWLVTAPQSIQPQTAAFHILLDIRLFPIMCAGPSAPCCLSRLTDAVPGRRERPPGSAVGSAPA